jgi:hypothetical protein
LKQASLKVLFGIHSMRTNWIFSMHNFYKSYSQDTTIFGSSSVNGFYTKLYMNLTFPAIYSYCELIRQHSEAVQ